jgi:tetratricopeptide (TPR) repeat protein
MLGKGFAALIGCVFSISITAFGQEHATQNGLREAEELFSCGQYRASLLILNVHAKDPASLFLMGRDYYLLGDFNKATAYLKKAVAAAPENSDYVDWLGRAHGKRAEISNPLSAIVLAKKAKEKFERAVQLNPKNADALSDLFDYYLQAPAVLGGGYSKAEDVAEKMSAVNPSAAFYEQWKLAQKQQRFQTAELGLRKPVALAAKDTTTVTVP